MSQILSTGETRVNNYTFDDQKYSVVTALSDGGWVVVWISNGEDGYGTGIYQQRYNAKGKPIGSEVRVHSDTRGDQDQPSVTALANGGWVVTWDAPQNSSNGSSVDVHQKHYNARGMELSQDVRVNSTTVSNQSWSSITSLKDGGWIVTWRSTQDGNQYDIFQRRYDETGKAVTDDVRVNVTTAGFQDSQSVTELTDGGWIVTWQSYNQDGSGNGIYQQRFDANGNPQLKDLRGNIADMRVNNDTTDDKVQPSVAGLANGGWVVVWNSHSQDGSNSGIYQQRYNETGSPIAGEVRVNTTTVDRQISPSITDLADGGWIVTWSSYNQDSDMYGIYQQRYGADGLSVGGEIRVNTTTYDNQDAPSVTGLKDGGWLVTWTSYGQDGSGEGIYQQRFNKEGQKIGPTTPTDLSLNGIKINEGAQPTFDIGDLAAHALVTGEGFTYTLLDDAGGRFEIVGNKLKAKDHIKLDYEQAQFHTIKVLVRDAVGATHEKIFTISVSDVQSENLVGNAYSDVIKGGQYSDVFDGAGGDDILWGSHGHDLLTGGVGKDMFVFDTRGSKRNNSDKITDFKVPDDTIWLDNAVFTKLGSGSQSNPGKLKKAYFAIGDKAKDGNDYLIYNKESGKLYYDADGSGSRAAVEFAKLKKGLNMTEKDFFVI